MLTVKFTHLFTSSRVIYAIPSRQPTLQPHPGLSELLAFNRWVGHPRTWMSRWKFGSKLIGSVGYFTPRDIPFTSR